MTEQARPGNSFYNLSIIDLAPHLVTRAVIVGIIPFIGVICPWLLQAILVQTDLTSSIAEIFGLEKNTLK